MAKGGFFTDRHGDPSIPKIIAWITGLIVIIAILLTSIAVVDTSKIAVVTTFGKVTGVAETGFHIKPPWQKYHEIDLSEQTSTQTYSTATKDSQSVTQDVTIRWTVDPAGAGSLYERFLGQHEARLIQATLPEAIKQGAASFSISEYIPKRDELSDGMERALLAKLDGTGIRVLYVGVSNIDLPDAYEKAIADRQVADERKRTALVEQETAKTQAETNNILAQSYAKPEFFKIEWLKKWDGKTPTTLVVSESGADTVFPIK